ncbi:MAG: NAD(P)-dependent oxidoreductase [Verrucomicrobiota bacterium]
MSESLSGYKIGFIGLGNMGWPMACHLHDAQAEMVVWNRSEPRRRAAEDHAMEVASSAVEVAENVEDGILCLNLTYSAVVEEVFSEIQDGMGPGITVIDFGTTGYAETRGLADRLAEKGGEWIDAPVSGGQVGAEAGDLTIMCGGSEMGFRRVLPVLEVLGGKITHLGGVGAGQVTKLANQLIVAQTIDAVAQALRLAEKAGLDPGKVREALRGGFAESRILELHGERMVRRDFEPGGRSALQLKDVRLMHELAAEVGLDSSTLENSLKLWERFVDELGHGDLDHSGLFRLYEED